MEHPDTQTIAIVDYGSQTAQLIARRVREQGVYSELVAYDAPAEELERLNPIGFILSGGPNSVYEPDAPGLPNWVSESGRPVLGICYGMQLLAHQHGGRVAPAEEREYGLATLQVTEDGELLAGLPEEMTVWMSHGDRVDALPEGFRSLGHTPNAPLAVMGNPEADLYAVQFHPEVVHTPKGAELIRNFVLNVCDARGDWTPSASNP